jgi:pre-mRNA-splicing factor SYF1
MIIEGGGSNEKKFLRYWTNRIYAAEPKAYEKRMSLYREALEHIPSSFKIWKWFLKESTIICQNLPREHVFVQETLQSFERCAKLYSKYPRVWGMYTEFAESVGLLSKAREVLDRGLVSLPISQHQKLWSLYIDFAERHLSDAELEKVGRRYTIVAKEFRDTLAEKLLKRGLYDQAIRIKLEIINDEYFYSEKHATKYDLVIDLIQLISKNADNIKTTDCEQIFRHFLDKYSDEVGNMWLGFADFYIRKGMFEKARSIFEEALNKIKVKRDFGIVYNGFLRFEEEVLRIVFEEGVEKEVQEDLEEYAQLEKEVDSLLDQAFEEDSLKEASSEIKHFQQLLWTRGGSQEEGLRMRKLENLINQREVFLNSCLLRQNQHSVKHWVQRLSLVKKQEKIFDETFEMALSEIDILKTKELLVDLFIAYSSEYFSQGNFRRFNDTCFRAAKTIFRSKKEYIKLWQFWIESLLSINCWEDSLTLLRALLLRTHTKEGAETNFGFQGVPTLLRSNKIWSLYIDLELNFGSQENVRLAFAKMIELKTITPSNVLNYVQILEQEGSYETLFQVFETSLQIFSWPVRHTLWISYLKKFSNLHGSFKTERARDLFERALGDCPENKRLFYYVMYGEFEEKHGLVSHAVEVYDRMVEQVPDSEKIKAFELYIFKVSEYLGLTKTRPLFEKALKDIQDDSIIPLGLTYADFEKNLGEIDRARSILYYLSQFSDPTIEESPLWMAWDQFELKCGNEDTYKEMMRVKRSVQTVFEMLPPSIKKVQREIELEEKKAEINKEILRNA